MTVELRPLGVKCNIQCRYCYQNSQRSVGNTGRTYDIERMKAAVLTEGGPFALFGGEPLLVPLADLEDLFAWGLEQFGENGIQTNGALLNAEHIRLFRSFRVRVGISLDGPGELNDVRWAGTLDRTRAATEKSQRAVEWLCEEGLAPSIIVTLHRQNASEDRLPILMEWMRRLASVGVSSARLHLLEIDNLETRKRYALTARENIEALMAFGRLQSELTNLQFDVFSDMARMLLGQDNSRHGTTCIWNACDPYTTRAVRGIEGNGQRTNCGRTNKEGIDFVKSETAGYERYLALAQTPQECGGCSGCRFFIMCKGQCPGTAINSDWRNRTEHCDVWKALYEWMEAELLAQGRVPLSLLTVRKTIEKKFIERWTHGKNATIGDVLAECNDTA